MAATSAPRSRHRSFTRPALQHCFHGPTTQWSLPHHMRRKLRKNVGIIGLGIVGSRAAAGLRAAGFHCFVWNRSAKPVPNFLGSPSEVAASCEIIQLFVADAAAVME